MFIQTNCVLVFAAFLVFASHMGQIQSSSQDNDNSDSTDPCVLPGVGCYCFLGYDNKGNDNKIFKWKKDDRSVPIDKNAGFELCEKYCNRQCDNWLQLGNDSLCKMIDDDYSSNVQKNFGCFVHFDEKEKVCMQNWTQIRAPQDLCCRKEKKECQFAYSSKYVLNNDHKLCLKKLDDGCIKGVTTNDKSPPVCCLTDPSTGTQNTYGCQPILHSGKIAENVTC